MEKSFQEKVQEIREKVIKKNPIYISRNDDGTFQKFTTLAKKKFDNDYGWTLKFLIDNIYPDPLSSDEFNELHDKLDILAEKLIELESKISETEKKPQKARKTLSGKEIGVEKNGN